MKIVQSFYHNGGAWCFVEVASIEREAAIAVARKRAQKMLNRTRVFCKAVEMYRTTGVWFSVTRG